MGPSSGSEAGKSSARGSLTQEFQLDPATVSRVIEMAWDDRTPFESIRTQFALDEGAVIALMRAHLKPGSYRSWRQRVRGRKTKHAALKPTIDAGNRGHGARHRTAAKRVRKGQGSLDDRAHDQA